MDERLQDRIDEYILGRMSNEERKTFEEEKAKDINLQEQCNYTKVVQEAVCEHAELQQLMNDFDDEIEKERYQKLDVACFAMPAEHAVNYCVMPSREEIATKPRTRRKVLLWLTGIAAILIVGLFVVNPFSVSEESELRYDSIVSGSAARNGSDLGAIDKLIGDKQYDKALAMIEEAEREMMSASLRDSMYKKYENYGEEENEQAEYEKRELQQRKDDLAWMKANALIGLGRKNEALKLLDQLRKGNGDYKAKAEQLYKKVKGL